MDFKKSLLLVKQGIKNQYFPSAAVAIGHKQELFVKDVFGYSAIYPKRIKANENTLYDMASYTKIMVTTMLAYRFIEDGRLHLYDRVSMFLPSPEDKIDITIFNLLTHTSGLPAHIMLSEKSPTKDQAIEVILSTPLENEVGKDVIYSCMGYILLGRILELIGGMPLDKLSEKYIFKPLGMQNTTFCPSGDNIVATELDKESNKYLQGIVHDENARYLQGIAGNAGVFSDITDSIKFAQMLSCKGEINGKPFISTPMFEAGIANYTYHMSESRGLGFSIKDDTRENPAGDLFSVGSFGHTGFTGTSIFVDYKTGLYVVLLTNRVHYGRENQSILRFRKLLHNVVMTEFSNGSRCN